ncbi:hypothetical protein [Bacillus pumilus]|uniref:hypothetical protein n=1 Tax=Bacillus pumilus TaxID=1408 RepID=UPI003CEDD3B4
MNKNMESYSLTETVQKHLRESPNGMLTSILQVSEHSLSSLRKQGPARVNPANFLQFIEKTLEREGLVVTKIE